jgi:hypothetical protein
MSYTVIRNEKQHFDIVEKVTQTTIKLSANETSAENICKNLNLGAGFRGFTPHFFADLNFKGIKT